MPKKPPKNAFFFFMLDYKRQQEAGGRRFYNGMKDVSIAAAEPWKRLTHQAKEKYEQLAKEAKYQDKHHGERYTSQGIPLSQVQKEEEERQRKDQDRKNMILDILHTAGKMETLTSTPFYILSFNYFTKDDQRYYPAELGLVRFSIKLGVTKKYHQLINPGSLPLGHAFQAKDHSERTHKLPPPPKAYGETGVINILTDMVNIFVEERSSKNDVFPVLVMEDEMDMVERIVMDMCEKAEIDYDGIKLLPLTFFFQKLREMVDLYYLDSKTSFTFAIAQSYLERDQYQYHNGNGCKFHEMDDVNIHCALSKVTRWAYYILDQTMDLVGVEKVPGFHFPKGCIIDDYAVTSKHSDKEEDYRKYEESSLSTYPRFKEEKDDFADESSIFHSTRDQHKMKSETYFDDDSRSSDSSHRSRHVKKERSVEANSTNPFITSSRYVDEFPALGEPSSSRRGNKKQEDRYYDRYRKNERDSRSEEEYTSKRYTRDPRLESRKHSKHRSKEKSYDRSRSRSRERRHRRHRNRSREESCDRYRSSHNKKSSARYDSDEDKSHSKKDRPRYYEHY